MSLNTFSPTLSVRTPGAVAVFLDAKCTQRAQVFDTNGRPLPGNSVIANDLGIPATFQCAATQVYFLHASGTVLLHTSGGVVTVSSSGSASPGLVTHVTGV